MIRSTLCNYFPFAMSTPPSILTPLIPPFKNSSAISPSVIHSTPGYLLMCSMMLQTISGAVHSDCSMARHHHSPLMHHYHLRLPADLWMDRHRKDKGVILSVCKVKLLNPQLLDYVSIDVALSPAHVWNRIERRPIVQVPVGRNLLRSEQYA